MASYVVMEPPGTRATDPVEKTVFIHDGFAWLGFLVPAIWLLWHRLWIEAGVTIVVLIGLNVASDAAGVGWAGPLFSLLISIFIGLEGQALRAFALARRGWRNHGVIEATNREEAEMRLILERDGFVPEPAQPASLAPRQTPLHTTTVPSRIVPPAPSFGLIPYPRKP